MQQAAEEAIRQHKPILAAGSLPHGAAVLSEPPLEHQPAKSDFLHIFSRTPNCLLIRALIGITVAGTVLLGCAAAAVYYVVLGPLGGRWWLFVATWIGVEAMFRWWYANYHVPKFEEQPQPHAPTKLDPLLHFKRVLAHARFYNDMCSQSVDWNEYLSTWFLGANPQDIRLGNLLEMMGYGFYYTTKAGLKECGKWRELHSIVHHFLETSRLPIKEGYDNSLRFMAHLWEPLRWTHRPLVFYVLTEAISACTGAGMLAMGYKRGKDPSGMVFYHSPGAPPSASTISMNQQQQPPPLLFLHGVGLGLLPYLLLISQLTACGLPVICPESKHVGMRLCSYIPTACDVAGRVVSILDQLGVGQVSIVAHSYGTFVASRLVQAHRQRAVHSLCLIDPVCFGMFLPGLLHNFIYRTPVDVFRQQGLAAAAKASFVWLISRDVHCAATFCRRFFWTDVNLWAEDIPEKCLIVLAGQDELLHAEEIRQLVTKGYTGVKRPSHMSPLGPLNAFNLDMPQQELHSSRPPVPRPPSAPQPASPAPVPLTPSTQQLPDSSPLHKPPSSSAAMAGTTTSPGTASTGRPLTSLTRKPTPATAPTVLHSSHDGGMGRTGGAPVNSHRSSASLSSSSSSRKSLSSSPIIFEGENEGQEEDACKAGSAPVELGDEAGADARGENRHSSSSSGCPSVALNPASSEDEAAYEEKPLPDTIRVLFNPSAAHADFLFDPAWTAEMVEQVMALATSNETAKVHVQRRRTAAQLVAASTRGPATLDHRIASLRRTMTHSFAPTAPEHSSVPAFPSRGLDQSSMQQEQQTLPSLPRLRRDGGYLGSGDVYAARASRTHSVPVRSVSDAAAIVDSLLSEKQVADLREMMKVSAQEHQPKVQNMEQNREHNKEKQDLVKRRPTKLNIAQCK